MVLPHSRVSRSSKRDSRTKANTSMLISPSSKSICGHAHILRCTMYTTIFIDKGRLHALRQLIFVVKERADCETIHKNDLELFFPVIFSQ